MTWNDLKRFIDDALAADGRDGSVEIDYVEVTNPSLDSALFIPEVAISNSKLIVFN
jgi:hypothetical protein